MLTVSIKDPSDITYPFSRNIYEDPHIVYHGTSSAFSHTIEKEGWKKNCQPYDMKDIQAVCALYDSIGYQGSRNGGYSTLKSFTLGTNNCYINDKGASFAQHFWYARNYSANTGGEIINALLVATKDFEKLVRDGQIRRKHRAWLKQEADEALASLFGGIDPTDQGIKVADSIMQMAEKDKKKWLDCISKLDDETLLRKKQEELHDIASKYMRQIEKSHPVVYAIKVQSEWFSKWHEPKLKPFPTWQINMEAVVDIPADAIIARANFVNGVEPFLPTVDGPFPVCWDV